MPNTKQKLQTGWEVVVVIRDFQKVFLYEKYFRVDTGLRAEQTYQMQKLVVASLLGCPRLC